jgi:hypothetical protein
MSWTGPTNGSSAIISYTITSSPGEITTTAPAPTPPPPLPL